MSYSIILFCFISRHATVIQHCEGPSKLMAQQGGPSIGHSHSLTVTIVLHVFQSLFVCSLRPFLHPVPRFYSYLIRHPIKRYKSRTWMCYFYLPHLHFFLIFSHTRIYHLFEFGTGLASSRRKVVEPLGHLRNCLSFRCLLAMQISIYLYPGL